jgi:hypothetical protein
MLNLDQVRLLENRVEKAVGKIQTLTAENTHLRTQLSGLQTRVNELEGLVRAFKDDQGRIEEGILSALDRLSAFEENVFQTETPAPPPVSVSEIPSIQDQEIKIDEEEAPSQANLDIEAEWDTDDTLNKQATASPDGQMDIF